MAIKCACMLIFFISFVGKNNCDEWNPSVDECDVKINPFECKPMIDGTLQPDPKQVDIDTRHILQTFTKEEVAKILSSKNFQQRKAINELFSKLHKEKLMEISRRSSEMHSEKTLFQQFRDFEDHPHFSRLLSDLLTPVPELYVKYLLESASADDVGNQDLNDIAVFMAILGGMSNKGLKMLNETIKRSGKEGEEISIAHLMRTRGHYDENFISLVVELLEGEREESTEINMPDFKDDLYELKENLKLEKVQRDFDEKFLCRLLTKRSFLHLNKLFTHDEETKSFPIKFDDNTPNDGDLRTAILELFITASHRVKGLGWILHEKRRSPNIVSLIIVSRLEIDLAGIKEVYEKFGDEKKPKLKEEIENNYQDDPLFVQVLLNLLDPPTEIAWKREETVHQE